MDAVSYSHADKQKQRIEKIIENPDSVSGVVTVPSTIVLGETITIPVGRTAVLPNLTIDGTLVVDGDVFVPSGATLGDLDAQLVLKAPLASPAFTGTVKIENANISAYGKNYIINGGFDYWQYATSQTTSGYGSDDRWNNNHNGSAKTHSQVNSTDTERALFNSSKFSRTAVTSVAGVSNYAIKYQNIEDVTKLAGKTITISFWAKADSNKSIAIELQQIFGTGGTPSAVVNSIGAQLVSLTSTWQKITRTITIPSIIGKTLGTNGVYTSYTGFQFWFESGSTYSSRSASLGQQSGTFDIAEVKLEEGSVATPWTPYEGEFGGEIQACQRYYHKYTIPVGQVIGIGMCQSTTNAFMNFQIPSMRVVPTVSYSGGLNLIVGNTQSAVTSVGSVYSSGDSMYTIQFTVASGLTAGYAVSFVGVTTSGLINLSSEL